MSTPAAEQAERWIVVNRWDEFQHPDALRTGNLPWLKTFTRLLSDASYLDLTAGERALLHGLWLEYARSRAGLRLSTTSLSRKLNLRVTQQQLDTLNHAGFIHFSASKPASTTASTMQAKTRREEKDLRAPARKSKTPATECPICKYECRRDWKLDEHLTNVHDLQGTLEEKLTASRAGRT